MFLTIPETAEYLNVSTKQIYRLCKKEDFPNPYSFGKKAYRFKRSEVDLWINTRKTSITNDIQVIPTAAKSNSKKKHKLNSNILNDFLDNKQNRGGLLNGTTNSI